MKLPTIKQFLAEVHSPGNMATTRDKLEVAVELLKEADAEFSIGVDVCDGFATVAVFKSTAIGKSEMLYQHREPLPAGSAGSSTVWGEGNV